jgi:hypothetical protein
MDTLNVAIILGITIVEAANHMIQSSQIRGAQSQDGRCLTSQTRWHTSCANGDAYYYLQVHWGIR